MNGTDVGLFEGYFLRIAVEQGEVRIKGNAKGLHHLADICTKISNQHGPGGHYHLMPGMKNVSEDSAPTVVEFEQ